jgi:YVTN family beta-propeller protein
MRLAHSGGRRPRRLAIPAAIAVTLIGGTTAIAALAQHGHAGPQGDGTGITPTGWKVTPVGTQVQLGERPYGMAVSPDGSRLLVSNDGVGLQSLQTVDPAAAKVAQEIDYLPPGYSLPGMGPGSLFIGVAYAPDGRSAYASAGANNQIHTYAVDGAGKLTEGAPIQLATTDGGGHAIYPFPAGLAVSGDGHQLYVADHFDNSLSIVSLPGGAETRVPLSSHTCTVGAWGDTSNGQDCLFPYTVALSRNGSKAYVSSWAQNTLTVVDTASKRVLGTITVGTHPSGLAVSPTRDELYVTNTESDSVSIVDTDRDRVRATVSLRPYAGARVGTNPNAIAVAPNGNTLYVADAGNNDVAVIDIAGGGPRVKGLIPTAWYPTALATDRSGGKLYVVGAKGLGAGPNPGELTDPFQYIGIMVKGQLSIVDLPKTDEQLQALTRKVRRNDGFAGGLTPRVVGENQQHAVPTEPGERSPIHHVIYIVNENRTYDQVLGDLGKGNGDPSLTLFGWKVAPNHHRLASQFVTLDNIYAAGEVSNDGWEWSTGANASTLDQKTWPTNYGGRGHFYTGEGGTLGAAPGSDPAHSYIWDELSAAHISYRNYGFWATDVPPVSIYNEPNLDAHTDHAYAGFNMQIPDQSRFAEWKREFDGYVAKGNLPTVEFLKFPRDHTCGTDPACPTPQAMVADSDLALGKLVDAVSHSRYWRDTAIFVIEDDAQDGPDQVDAHRVLAQVISPYTQSGEIDSTFYSSVSMLRTMELILGIGPLTQFDTAANVMTNAFMQRPSFAPYSVAPPAVTLSARNSRSAPMARIASNWNFHREDAVPEALLNLAIWKAVKGPNSDMPAPVHRLFPAQVDGPQVDSDG